MKNIGYMIQKKIILKSIALLVKNIFFRDKTYVAVKQNNKHVKFLVRTAKC
jgi:hypothetical protein